MMPAPCALPRLALSDEDIANCYPTLVELRPQLVKKDFVGMIRQMQKEGYQLLFIEKSGETVAVAGFRMFTNLYKGRCLYVDDLVTADAHRSTGHGRRLLDWLYGHGQQQGCTMLHLDSGCQRQQAHKFYFRQHMTITSFHFARNIPLQQG